MKTTELFTGVLIDGRPVRIWVEDDSTYLRIGDTTIASPKDAWFDFVNAVLFAARKQDALEEGNLEELEELDRDVKEREALIKEGECDCDH